MECYDLSWIKTVFESVCLCFYCAVAWRQQLHYHHCTDGQVQCFSLNATLCFWWRIRHYWDIFNSSVLSNSKVDGEACLKRVGMTPTCNFIRTVAVGWTLSIYLWRLLSSWLVLHGCHADWSNQRTCSHFHLTVNTTPFKDAFNQWTCTSMHYITLKLKMVHLPECRGH